MKHLKLFENFSDIDSICKKYRTRIHGNYTINSDGTVDVDGNVDLSYLELTELPIRFGKVSGDFDCFRGKLKTLLGAPQEVGGDFHCHNNELTTLLGCPSYVGGDFNCSHNKLTTLEGGPSYVGGNFQCSFNRLISLEGGPKSVGGGFDCNDNKLTTLRGGPEEVGGVFGCYKNKLITLEGSPKELGSGLLFCHGNLIENIYRLFSSYKEYQDSLDYNYLRGTDIVKSRFREALSEIGKELPESIKGYNYI